MRVWDVSAGYLNRQSLLGEHRELHGLYQLVVQRQRGHAQHPEARRWVGALSGLALRHAELAAEMGLRGYVDRTPLVRRGRLRWPTMFITEPVEQIGLLRGKYADRDQGRIPLPRSAHELWGQHKYSVLARDPEAYRHFGRLVAKLRRGEPPLALGRDLVAALRVRPSPGPLFNALEHMWGHVSEVAGADDRLASRGRPAALLAAIQRLATVHREPFLLGSTALSELAVHVK